MLTRAALFCVLGAGASAAAPPVPASPGYAEITAPDDHSVTFEQQPDDHHPAPGYAIETAPTDPIRRVAPAPAPAATVAALPVAAPLVVIIRFDARRQRDAASAALLAASLTRQGIAVSEAGLAGGGAARAVGFVFDEDRAAAAALVKLLPAALGHLAPARIDPNRVADPQPGLIQITLGEDRSTS